MKKEQQLRKNRVLKMIDVFSKMFPHPMSELLYETDWEFLVAVVLSAQCTDKRVNVVTRKLFKKYPTLRHYANADLKEFEKDIFSTGFYKNKAKNIVSASKIILEKYKGKLPKSMGELITIPGVGRKTANVILSNLYDIHQGIAVDTHVIRISRKFDLVSYPYTPVSIERELMEIVPEKFWKNINHYMVLYGRYHSKASTKEIHDELTEIFPKAVHYWYL